MIVDARGISFGYRRDLLVLRDISVSVAPGRIGVLLGPNGSGKSTLLRVLLGQLRGEGDVLWRGKKVESYSLRELARVVAYLPQSPGHEVGQTVREVLRSGRTPYLGAFGLESARDVDVVAEVAGLLELSEMVDRPMEELSGGQRQRVFLGRALVQEPVALLLDEPNTFLDMQHQAQLWQLLRKLARERGIGVLAASHDLNLSAAFADELILLNKGSVAARGSADQVLRPAVLSEVYGMKVDRIEREGRTPVVFADVE